MSVFGYNTFSLSMVQQIFLIYCMPVHIYELVSCCTRQGTVDFISMYSLGQSHPPYCLYVTAQERPEQGGRNT